MTQPNQATALTIVEPGQGRFGEIGGIGAVFKLWGEDTNGYVSVVEHTFAVGALAEPHRHTREDEYSIVTEGVIGFRSEDREAVLEAGGYITKPRGQLHAMWNAGSTPARMIEIISPAGLEKLALAASYGVQFEDPPWLPDQALQAHSVWRRRWGRLSGGSKGSSCVAEPQ
jgi:quercetin dioxygenase-like cupin family protein